VRWFKQAAYARHDCWPAHWFLGELYRACGANEQAARAYRVVLQLLATAQSESGIEFIPLDLPAGEIRFLCQRRLEKLGNPVVEKH